MVAVLETKSYRKGILPVRQAAIRFPKYRENTGPARQTGLSGSVAQQSSSKNAFAQDHFSSEKNTSEFEGSAQGAGRIQNVRSLRDLGWVATPCWGGSRCGVGRSAAPPYFVSQVFWNYFPSARRIPSRGPNCPSCRPAGRRGERASQRKSGPSWPDSAPSSADRPNSGPQIGACCEISCLVDAGYPLFSVGLRAMLATSGARKKALASVWGELELICQARKLGLCLVRVRRYQVTLRIVPVLRTAFLPFRVAQAGAIQRKLRRELAEDILVGKCSNRDASPLQGACDPTCRLAIAPTNRSQSSALNNRQDCAARPSKVHSRGSNAQRILFLLRRARESRLGQKLDSI